MLPTRLSHHFNALMCKQRVLNFGLGTLVFFMLVCSVHASIGIKSCGDYFESTIHQGPILGDQRQWFESYYQLTSNVYSSFSTIQERLLALNSSDESDFDESLSIDELLLQLDESQRVDHENLRKIEMYINDSRKSRSAIQYASQLAKSLISVVERHLKLTEKFVKNPPKSIQLRAQLDVSRDFLLRASWLIEPVLQVLSQRQDEIIEWYKDRLGDSLTEIDRFDLKIKNLGGGQSELEIIRYSEVVEIVEETRSGNILSKLLFGAKKTKKRKWKKKVKSEDEDEIAENSEATEDPVESTPRRRRFQKVSVTETTTDDDPEKRANQSLQIGKRLSEGGESELGPGEVGVIDPDDVPGSFSEAKREELGTPDEKPSNDSLGLGTTNAEILDQLFSLMDGEGDPVADLLEEQEKLREESERNRPQSQFGGIQTLSDSDAEARSEQWRRSFGQRKFKFLSDEPELDDSIEPLPELDDAMEGLIVGEFVDLVYKKTLNRFNRPSDFTSQLAQVIPWFEKFYESWPVNDRMQQRVIISKELLSNASGASEGFDDLQWFGLDLKKKPISSIKEGLSYLDFLLKAMAEFSDHPKRSKAHGTIVNAISDIEGQTAGGVDPNVGHSVFHHLLGPLSKKSAQLLAPPESTLEDEQLYNASALGNLAQSGRIDDLLVLPRLKEFLAINRVGSWSTALTKGFDGGEVAISESEPDLVLATELDQYPHFYKDGADFDIEIMRFLSGSQLAWSHRDEVSKQVSTQVKKKIANIYLVDISGSNSGEQRWLIRNLVILAALDLAQQEEVDGIAEHVSYMMKFDGSPHNPERLGDPDEHFSYFDRLRKTPFGSDGSTSITRALAKAYELVAEHQASGSELDQANIILLTDGADTIDFEHVRQKRQEVQNVNRVILNAITYGGYYNEKIGDLVRMQGGEGYGDLGYVKHIHIPVERIGPLVQANSIRDRLVTDSTFDRESFDERVLPRLKDSIRELLRLPEVTSTLEENVNDGSTNEGESEADSQEEAESSEGLETDQTKGIKKLSGMLSGLSFSMGSGFPGGSMFRAMSKSNRAMVDALRSPSPAKKTRSIDNLARVFLGLASVAVTERFNGEREDVFEEYWKTVARQYNLEPEDVVLRISPKYKSALNKWLKSRPLDLDELRIGYSHEIFEEDAPEEVNEDK